MKIGIYDPYLNDLGGGEKYMMTIASYLSKDNEVSVFWDEEKDIKTLLQRFSLDLSKVSIKKNIFSLRVSFINRIMESRKYDSIIFLSDGSIPFVLSKLFVHVQQPLDKFQNNSFKDKLKIRRVNTFFCNSAYTRNFISDRFNVKTTVIYPPVKLFPKKVKKENVILHVGRFRVKNIKGLDDYKKQGVMIDAFKKMVDKGLKGWIFVLATSVKPEDDYSFEKLKDRSKGYPIEFLINKNNSELWDIYSKAKIYWHASGYGEDLINHPEFAEHFGISTVEAMGAGAVPVVISAGGQKEIVEDGKNGFLWNNIDELERQTLNLTNNKKLLESISKEAKNRAKYFSYDKFCQRIEELIKS